MSFSESFYNWYMGGIGLLGLIGTIIAAIWSKKRLGWIAGIATATLGLLLLIHFQLNKQWSANLNDNLPSYFRIPLPFWLFAFGSGAFCGIAYLVHSWKPATTAAPVLGTDFVDLESAWDQVIAGLSQAGVDPALQNWFILFGPDYSQIDGLIAASGVKTRAVAPKNPGALVRAHLTPDGVLLNASGCTAIGASSTGGEARLTRLCELIRNLNPEVPPLRGITLVFPLDKATKRAAEARADLQRIADTLLVRAPICVVFTRLDALTGAREFLSRMKDMDPRYLDARCGFSLPAGMPFDSQSLARGMSWLERWFSAWRLNLMVQDYTRSKENAAIFKLSEAIRTLRPEMEGILNDIFVSAKGTEPYSLRGVYICAADEQQVRAFAPGLLRGPKARLIADVDLATWSKQALKQDKADRKLALKIGIGVVLLGGLWWFDILHRLYDQGWSQMIIGVVVLLALIAGWCVGLLPYTAIGRRLLTSFRKK